MEKRAFRRTPVRIEAELVSDYLNFAAFIGNISASGIYIITIHTEDRMDFAEETPLELKFQIPSGAMLRIQCIKRWSSTITANSLLGRMGMEIIDPPAEYSEYLKTLQ
ncbi:MAG: PilZ domain-containing protein [Nitrospiraceae bacterium]|nr:MAG: PilZ domain-containing protein [Nitrospiraceae bacterium]